MPNIQTLNTRKMRLRGGLSRSLLVDLDAHLDNDIKKLKAELLAFCGKKISAAHILREGARLYMRSLRVQMAKARKGQLHAKPRPTGR